MRDLENLKQNYWGRNMITKLISEAFSPPKLRTQFCRASPSSSPSSRALFSLSDASSLKCFCTRNHDNNQAPSQVGFEKSVPPQPQGFSFSALGEDIPWESESVWTTMGFYFFTLHIPLSFGWKSMAAAILESPDLDPQTQAISLLVAQTVELVASMTLLKLTSKPQYKFVDLFRPDESSKRRNWLLASSIGFGFLLSLVFVTSFVLDSLLEPKAVNNPIVKEMLGGTDTSKTASLLVYCAIAPLLEETVYRGFLLRSLSSTMTWQKAVLVSSLVFSLAHFSGENFVQLFVVGCVLGCSYCWSGNLWSSFAVHSLYNSMTLIITFFL